MKNFKENIITVLVIYVLLQFKISTFQNRTFSHESYVQPQNKVVIGSVYCRADSTSVLADVYFDQTIILLKSAIISAHRNNISILEIHLFVNHVKEDEPFFRKKVLEEMDISSVTVNLQVHSAVDKIPKKYENHMIYDSRFRCGYTRHFMPDTLPNVDSIIYMDSDIIVTGDLMKHWKLLSQMDDHQMVAMGRNSPEENKMFTSTYKYLFGFVPHVPPRGVNSGLLVMNLTRMREFKMSEKLVQVYKDYSQFVKKLSGQRVMNILLYYNPGLLLSMPCNLHFLDAECKQGPFYCHAALEDPQGIHLVHGTNGQFRKGQLFHPIFKFYEKFNVSELSNAALVDNLMRPIKQAYLNTFGNNTAKCAGTLGEVLFKNLNS